MARVVRLAKSKKKKQSRVVVLPSRRAGKSDAVARKVLEKSSNEDRIFDRENNLDVVWVMAYRYMRGDEGGSDEEVFGTEREAMIAAEKTAKVFEGIPHQIVVYARTTRITFRI